MECIEMSENKVGLSFWTKVFKIIIPLVAIVAGGAAWSYFKTTAPVMKRSAPQRHVSVVEVQTAGQRNARSVISAMGTVAASREVTLKAQVSGVVLSVNDQFVPGGLMAKGTVLLALDPSDYEVEVKKAQSALANARAAQVIEQGSQNIAREELRLLSEISSETVTHTDLALRKPQLLQAQADVTSAEADLRQAMLNLSRTEIQAPFNAMIIERNVNVGAYVGSQESLVTLVGTDEFWIKAMVSLDRLAFIDLDYPGGCPVSIRSQAGKGHWEGRVIHVSGKLNDTSRMATVIVAVTDPLGKTETGAGPRLMIDDYVFAEITGRELANVIELPRAALKDDNTVWINHNNALDIRKVTLAWKSPDKIYLQTGVSPGEQVVMSELSTPVQGMPLRAATSTAVSLADTTAQR